MPNPTSLRVSLLTPTWRAAIAALLATAAAHLPLTLSAVLLMTDPPVTPPLLLRTLLMFALAPAAAGALLLRLFRATVCLRNGSLEISRPGLCITVPPDSISELLPWRAPLPGCGLSLRLGPNPILPHGLLARDLDSLLDLLAAAGVDTARAHAHPSALYARMRMRYRQISGRRLLLKFVGFGALPAGTLFYTHQHIAYGGPLGQYYLYGLGAYLETFSVYWLVTSIYLLLYASVWRGLAEVASLAAAWLTPAHAGSVRQAAERACRLLYFGGVPLLLLLRYTA